ncbi:hypothetical protein AN661_0206885 [Enterobacter hormaechei subsp. hoffmannii]|nr:hypothetical protein AN661_0206885 [Enterobacter hormaechei subsp. hoffmannii]
MKQVAGKVEEAEKRNAELEARCAALAAENALLKKSEPAPFSKLMMDALDIYQAGADEVPELAMLSAYKKLRDGLKTPATDAFLAEVRAAAVDEVCLKISNAIINCYQDEQIGLDAAATICGDFAAQLRKGVQS